MDRVFRSIYKALLPLETSTFVFCISVWVMFNIDITLRYRLAIFHYTILAINNINDVLPLDSYSL